MKGVVGKVVLGEADAGLRLRTDVKPVAGKVRAIAVPARGQPTVRYEIAVVRASRHAAAARAFVAARARRAGPRGASPPPASGVP